MTDFNVDALADAIAERLGNGSPAPLLDAKQAAALLNVPASWLLAEARAGRVPSVQLGKYRRFKRDDLLAWLDCRASGPRRRS
jgi:excisionase family DNA binding protein